MVCATAVQGIWEKMGSRTGSSQQASEKQTGRVAGFQGAWEGALGPTIQGLPPTRDWKDGPTPATSQSAAGEGGAGWGGGRTMVAERCLRPSVAELSIGAEMVSLSEAMGGVLKSHTMTAEEFVRPTVEQADFVVGERPLFVDMACPAGLDALLPVHRMICVGNTLMDDVPVCSNKVEGGRIGVVRSVPMEIVPPMN